MAKKSKKRGRPKEGRIPVKVFVKDSTLSTIDSLVDRDDKFGNSRGKIIDRRFEMNLGAEL